MKKVLSNRSNKLIKKSATIQWMNQYSLNGLVVKKIAIADFQ